MFKELFELFLRKIIVEILKYFEGVEDRNYALKYAFYACFLIAIIRIIMHLLWFYLARYSMTLGISLSGLMYKKLFKLNMVSFDNNTSGQFINIISNDCGRIENAFTFFPFIFIAPFVLAFVIVMLINTVDITILSGLLVTAVVLPIQSALGKIYDHMRRITSKKCDKRIDLLYEIFNGIKIIKMYCWEELFKKLVERLRMKELSYQRNLFYVSAFNEIIAKVQLSVIMFVNITAFIYFSNLPLLPRYIVIAMGYYTLIENLELNFRRGIISLITASVSLKRIQVII